tara:strand:+ start:14474 stop:16585 length:2112 start_codon:yes stop_codon:yes gene_type:complete
LKKFLGLILFFIFVFIGLALYILNSGHLIWEGVKYANDKYLEEYQINLEDINFSWENESLTQKFIHIQGEDICIKLMGNHPCLDQLEVAVRFDLLDLPQFEIVKVHAASEKIDFTLPSTEKAPKQESALIDIGYYLEMIRDQLKSIPAENIFLSFPQIQLRSGEKIQTIALELKRKENQDQLQGWLRYKTNKLAMSTPINIQLGQKPEVKLNPELSMGDIHLKSMIDMDFMPEQFKLDFQLNKFHYTQKYKLGGLQCHSKFGYQEQIKLNCDQGDFSALIKKNFNFNIQADIELANKINLNNHENFIILNARGEGKKSNAFDIELNSQLFLSFNSSELQYKLEKLNVLVDIKKFQRIEKELRSTPFAIPAPFNNLQGQVKLTGKLDEKLNYFEFPLEAEFDLLQNKNVQLKGRLESYVKLNQQYQPTLIKGDFQLARLKFFVPDIDPLYGIPNVAPSSKINKEIRFEKKKKSSLDYDLKIVTSNNESIQIHNQFFEPYLALGAKIHVTPQKLTLNIDASDKAKLVYLKRELLIKEINVSKESKSTLIDLTFEDEIQGYKIILNVVGSADKPRLLLSSFPSLPREDNISLLLYRRKSNELTGLDQASVGSTQNAISNRALGLFSIWAFASTPIDSVSYDSETNTYNAVVGLPGGASVSIGTNWDQVNNLTFRKRITNTWAVVTTFEPKDTDSKETIMLQKEISF